jgi:hypothetical protein
MGGEDFDDITTLVDFLMLMRDGEEDRARALIDDLLTVRKEEEEEEEEEEDGVMTLDLTEIVRRDGQEEDGGEMDVLLLASRICQRCDRREINSSLLPCGHLCFCSICASTEDMCSVCNEYFRGFCTFFLA